MSSPSEPLVRWLRTLARDKGMNVAALAGKAGLERSRLKKVLGGREPILVDELLTLYAALDITAEDLVAMQGVEGLEAVLDAAEDTPTPSPEPLRPAEPAETPEPRSANGLVSGVVAAAVDPLGNHPRQIVELAFALGCDLFFLVDPAQLRGGGAPEHVLAQYQERDLPLKLDAAYHAYNEPQLDADGMTLVLSFDALYTCRIPWSAVKQITLFPSPEDPTSPPDDGEDDHPSERPTLRLVT